MMWRSMLGALALVGMAACGSSSSSEESSPVGFAAIALCDERPFEERNPCYEEFITTYTQENDRDTRTLLTELTEAGRINPDIEFNCHSISHAIGRWTFQRFGNVADSFDACDQTCSAGCFHGVMERLFAPGGDSGDGHLSYEEIRFLLPDVCAPENLNNPDFNKIFQCLHGLGHAVLYALGYDLDVALMSCDVLATDLERTSCYSGVFMENVTAFDRSARDLDPSDPLYPCTRVDERYRSQCYSIQADAMTDAQMKPWEVGAACLQAGAYVGVCMQGMGRIYSGWAISRHWEQVLPICEQYAPGYEESCIYGVVSSLVNATGDAQHAYPYCNALRPDLQTMCYGKANQYLTLAFDYTGASVEEQCRSYAWIGEALCLSQIFYNSL